MQQKNRGNDGEHHHDEGSEEPTMPMNHTTGKTGSPHQSGSIFEFFMSDGACCACGGGLNGVRDEGAVVTEEDDQSSIQESPPTPPQKRNHTWIRKPRSRLTGKREEKDFF